MLISCATHNAENWKSDHAVLWAHQLKRHKFVRSPQQQKPTTVEHDRRPLVRSGALLIAAHGNTTRRVSVPKLEEKPAWQALSSLDSSRSVYCIVITPWIHLQTPSYSSNAPAKKLSVNYTASTLISYWIYQTMKTRSLRVLSESSPSQRGRKAWECQVCHDATVETVKKVLLQMSWFHVAPRKASSRSDFSRLLFVRLFIYLFIS